MTSNLSVIIPNYNNERFIERCINSVLRQSLSPDYIIVVDDHSTDLSKEIINRYAKANSNVHPIFLAQNSGVSHARNIGIKYAVTDYVTTLDADDFYYSDTKLEEEMKLIKKARGKAVSYSKIVRVNEEDDIIGYPKKSRAAYLNGKAFYKLVAGYKENTVPRDYIFPRSILEVVGYYDEKSNLFEDLDLLIRISRELPIYCTYKFGTAYRIKNFGLSQRPKSEIVAAKRALFEREYCNSSVVGKASILYYYLLSSFRKMISCGIKSVMRSKK